MQSEDRVIHFSTELIHKPGPMDIPKLQKLYYELSQVRGAAYDSSDFGNPNQVRFHSKRAQRSQSIALFLPDRIVLIEEWADIPLVDFIDKVSIVAREAMSALAINSFAAQTATVRSTFALTHFNDARVFMLDQMCNQKGNISPFIERPIGVGGLRLVLPETPEHKGTLHVNIESFRQSLNEVFVECKGVYGGLQMGIDELDSGLDRIRDVRNFISGNVFPYLNQYDLPQVIGDE